MSYTTDNYEFTVPEIDDIPDISVLSQNWDNLDEILNDIDTRNKIETVSTTVDLNGYTEQGIYRFTSSHTPTNVPSGCTEGWLFVVPWNNAYEAVQFWLNYADRKVYIRKRVYPTWGEWNGLTTSAELSDIYNQLHGAIESNTALIVALQAAIGSPLVASSADSMTDQTKIYVYTGTTTSSLTNGHWYYYNNGWTDGGVYNSFALETDKTLSIPDMAADAKAAGDEIADLKSAILQETKSTTWTDGYIYQNGSVTASSGYQYSAPIHVDYGRICVELSADTIVSAISQYDSVADRYNPLVLGAGSQIFKQYIYDVTEPGDFVISYRKATGIGNIEVVLNPDLNSIPPLVKRTENILYATADNSYINDLGVRVGNNLYSITSPILLEAGNYSIEAYCSNNIAVVSETDSVFTSFTPVIVSTGIKSRYTLNVTTAGYYVFSFRKSDGLSITRNLTLNEALDEVDKLVSTEVLELGFNTGYVNNAGNIIDSNNYKYSEPFYVESGRIVVNCGDDTVCAVIAQTNNTGLYYIPLVLGQYTVIPIEYSYEVESPGYFCVSYRSATGSPLIRVETDINSEIQKIEEDIRQLEIGTNESLIETYMQDSITPNFSIKAFKTLNYSDGTTNKYSQVLWCDETDDSYYLSQNVYSEKYKIFEWDTGVSEGNNSSMYQAVILANGDILFVFQTQFKEAGDTTAHGAYRRNPILYDASNGFQPEEIDFGNSVKPTGWLQNVGALYSYTYNRLYIAEYTRANEQYARIWAVDMPVTTVSNWHIILEKEIPTPYQTGFKHFHSCQQDPYTGILYFSSGDNDLSSAVWYSLDGGDTLIQLDDYDAGKYRMLNMAFTKDYVYWASDQWKPDHFLWRIARDSETGILDVSTLTKLVTFDDEVVGGVSRIATYTTVYMPCYNCLIMLDRDDGAIQSYVPIRAYDIGSGNVYEIARMIPLSSGVWTGFRNVAVTCYVKSNEIVCSFDSKLPNYNKGLGNNSTNRINNLILRIYKNGSDFTVDFDTIY